MPNGEEESILAMNLASIGENLSEGIRRLKDVGIDNARSEACWMLEELMNVSASEMASRLSTELPEEVKDAFWVQIRRRASGEPLQYVIGNVDFYNVRLSVGRGVLIPRPETEELVELAVSLVNEVPEAICDVCTGSGAIALALAKEFPTTKVFATDISADALHWAERNRQALELMNVSFFHGDLFNPLPSGQSFGMITANPPYVSERAYNGLDSVVRDYEPKIALVSDDMGMGLLKRIAVEAKERLLPGGWLVCEIGDDQGEAIARSFQEEGYVDIRICKDMAHLDRMAIGRRKVA
ncbi:MAG: peptide chain release factor N(5)-glutamine methyltransferase [Victivallales bacterium]|nr:peptide chain release factor N(5)-glutamine methyltransferase [Victivallales bacterium]